MKRQVTYSVWHCPELRRYQAPLDIQDILDSVSSKREGSV